MVIIWAAYSLKCKLLSRTFKDVDLIWYMGLLYAFINNNKEILRKLVHQFAASCHRNVSTTNLFNILQGPTESLKDYLTRFNETTIKVVAFNQKMFMGVFKMDSRRDTLMNPSPKASTHTGWSSCQGGMLHQRRRKQHRKKVCDVKEQVPGVTCGSIYVVIPFFIIHLCSYHIFCYLCT